MIKCWSIKDALDAFSNACWEASEVYDIYRRQEIIFRSIDEIKNKTNPELIPDVIKEIDDYIDGELEIQRAARNYKNVFNPNFNLERFLERISKADGEETDEAKINRKARVKKEFLTKRFKDKSSKSSAARVMNYFQREAKLKLMSAFMVDRDHGYLVAENEVSSNIKRLKLDLLNTIVDYLKSRGYSENLLGITDLYDEAGVYQDPLYSGSDIRKAIDAKLQLGVAFTTQDLKDSYERFRSKKSGWEAAKQFIDAYNAKVLLDDFDALTTMLLGTIVLPGAKLYNDLGNDSYYTKYERATNMWGNGLGDDVENIADLVSDVIQYLVTTSRRYTWKGEAMLDLYLSFKDFNYIITKIKDLTRNPISKTIVLDDNFFLNESGDGYTPTTDTERTINTLRQLKQKQGYENFDPTLEDVVAFISDNPQRHLHTIFDLLCNTSIIKSYNNFNDNDKNLIWTLGKEIFGSWPTTEDGEGNPIYSRSLYDLHKKSNGDKIYEILTLAADSIFAEHFLQYYEDLEGTLKIRFLQDYAMLQVKRELLYKMRQTSGMLDENRFKNFTLIHHIKVNKGKHYFNENTYRNPDNAWFVKAEYLKDIEINIGSETDPILRIQCIGGKVKPLTSSGKDKNVFMDEYQSIWQSHELRSFIADAIGIDFDSDPELASAYEEGFKQVENGESKVDYFALLNDITRLCGSVVYNQAFNNEVIPSILENSGLERTRRVIELLCGIQYGESAPRIDPETGVTEMILDKNKDAYLDRLGLAMATVNGLLTASQFKTGEGTTLAAQCLSCLRSSHAYQILTQNKNKNSATRHNNYVNNENGFYTGLLKRREFKSDATVKTNTDMSSVESFTASFINFLGAFVENDDTANTLNRSGKTSIIPAVDSDKSLTPELLINLRAYSKNQSNKRFIDMADSELEYELKCEFGTMYDTIVKEINIENFKLASLLGIDENSPEFLTHPIETYRNLLKAITYKLCDNATLLNLLKDKYKDEDLGKEITLYRRDGALSPDEVIEILEENSKYKEIIGKKRKDQVLSNMHRVMLEYNKKHRRKPIEMCEHVHYLYNKKGELVPNDTLIALWGRFLGDLVTNDRLGITALYPKGHANASTIEGYFKYEKDIRMAQELLQDGAEIFLYGSLSNKKQKELEVLRGYTDWITDSGKMAIAKVFVPKYKYRIGDTFISKTGIKSEITGIEETPQGALYSYAINGLPVNTKLTEAQVESAFSQVVTYSRGQLDETQGYWKITQDAKEIEEYSSKLLTRDMIKVHPLLSKLNRISYLAALQYTSAVGGAHYVYKGGGANVLEEEASRWLASNKRNVCYASTVHKYQNKTLNGAPKYYQIAPIEDIKSIIYNMMGDLDSHKPIDGGMFVNPWLVILENFSLAGEAAGLDKKQFGTYYYERYAAGGIIKTAGFALTNQRLRNSIPYRNLCKNMTHRTWLKEFVDDKGYDIEEVLDITRDYKGNLIDWIQDSAGRQTFYTRNTNGGRGRFRLAKIESLGNNQYKIYEYPVTAKGETDTTHPDILRQLNDRTIDEVEPIQRMEDSDNGIFTINNNWDMYNLLFGGAWSMSLNEDGVLQYSGHSIEQMVYALNNIGYTRTTDNNDSRFGEELYEDEEFEKIETQDELWLPLKYSDIQYAPNIGALKSTQMNVNPKEGMYEDTYLNAMNIMMALLGIQLDKEHHADESEVSMPTQIIQACANKGYTIHYTDKLYKSLSTLTEMAIQDCMDGIMELMPGNENKGTLLTEVANIIVSKLIKSQDDSAALEAVMAHLIEKAKGGKKLTPDDVVGQVAWSDASAYNKIYNDLSSHLTNAAIKMKFSGTLSVICPTEKMEQMYGNRRLGAYEDTDRNLSEQVALALHLQEIREGKHPKQLIYDMDRDEFASVTDKLNLASNLDTQHHYWVEWTYSDGTLVTDEHGEVFRKSITIEQPSDYYKLKDWLGYGATVGEITTNGHKIPRNKIQVARIYENITEGRELGAYNARFLVLEPSDSGSIQLFCIFDLDSVKALFDYNDLKVNLENAIELLRDDKIIEPQYDYAENLILRLLAKKYKKTFEVLNYKSPKNPTLDSLLKVVNTLDDRGKLEFAEAAFKVCRVLTYKGMEQDLFKISKDYNGTREVYVNGDLLTVNPNTIKTQAYELIMPKVYQSRFGLKEGDQVQEILADKDFFVKRAIDRVRTQHVADDCFHYELKNFNGDHVYIWNSRLGLPDPEIFREIEIQKSEDKGRWVREDLQGNFIHTLASENDRVMKIGRLGHEVIVTDNPEYYLLNMKYNIATFSNQTVKEESIREVAEKLKGSKNKSALNFLKALTYKDGNLRKFSALKKRNQAVNEISLEGSANEPPEITLLIQQFIEEGRELHASFDKSLDIIAGRIPAQSQLSFMPQRVVAFDDNDINTAYVSTFQLFLLGSKK